MEKVSLKVIANEIGVSIATVSLVLNGKNKRGRVSEAVSKKIIDKAAELNYVPNSLAKGLKMGHSKTIGLIVADISNVFFGTLALHVQNYAEKKGYMVIIANTDEQLSEMDKMIKLLKSRQVDGFIITPTEYGEKSISNLLREKTPLVLVDRNFPELTTCSVMINNYEISYKATKELINKGCKNIALISYRQDQYHINERKNGCIEALKDHKIYRKENIKEVRYDSLQSDVEKAVNELLQNNSKIDGMFCTTNSISINAVKELVKNKIDIQKQIQLFCFDENEAFQILTFSVPYVKQPIEELAQNAVRRLIEQIEEKIINTETCVVEAELILN